MEDTSPFTNVSDFTVLAQAKRVNQDADLGASSSEKCRKRKRGDGESKLSGSELVYGSNSDWLAPDCRAPACPMLDGKFCTGAWTLGG